MVPICVFYSTIQGPDPGGDIQPRAALGPVLVRNNLVFTSKSEHKWIPKGCSLPKGGQPLDPCLCLQTKMTAKHNNTGIEVSGRKYLTLHEIEKNKQSVFLLSNY